MHAHYVVDGVGHSSKLIRYPAHAVGELTILKYTVYCTCKNRCIIEKLTNMVSYKLKYVRDVCVCLASLHRYGVPG